MQHKDVSSGVDYAAALTYGRTTLDRSGLDRVRVLDTVKRYRLVREDGVRVIYRTDEPGCPPKGYRAPDDGMLAELLDAFGDVVRQTVLLPRDLAGTWEQYQAAQQASAEAHRANRLSAQATENEREDVDRRLREHGVVFSRHPGEDRRTFDAAGLLRVLDDLFSRLAYAEALAASEAS